MPDATARAAIYARFSTDLQSDRSIDDQVALCTGYADREGLSVTKVYSDRAKTSASIIGRDGLLTLMEDARAGAFTALIVESLDRISRDQEDLAGVFKRLEFAGVDIIAVHEGRADAITVGIRGLMGHLFLTDLKHKVRRGMTGVVREGRNAGGRAYGYRTVPGKPGELEIEEKEAAVVRRIFDDYVAGKVPRTIAAELNAEGILPPRGTHWAASTINGNKARGHGILCNPLYDGRIVWNRVRMVRHPDTGRRISRPNPPEEWQTAEAEHLRIVDPGLFAAAQERRSRRSRQPGVPVRRSRRPFSGLLKCGVCGGGMVIHDRRGAAVRMRCSAAKEGQTCSNSHRYRLDKVETALLDGLRAHLAHPDYLKEFVKTYNEELRRLYGERAREKAKAERRARKAEEAHERLIDLAIEGVVSKENARTRIPLLEAEAKEARRIADQTEGEMPVVELHPAAWGQFGVAIDNIVETFASDPPTASDKMLGDLKKLFERIVVNEPDENGAVTVDVVGRISALLGPEAEDWGFKMVAEEGLEPPTRGL